MYRKLILVLMGILLLTSFLLATGKIRGKVTDKDSGEPLIGATVALLGTTRGAVTDETGGYSILNVEVGTYTVRTSFIGYQSVQISNIRVNENLTAEANFNLAKSAVQVGAVEIIAQRPLIEKSATNETRIINSDMLSAIPIRSVTEAAALQPGVVLRNNLVYIRGSRADETGFILNGVNVTDPYNGGRGVTISPDAVEQIEVQTGGYPAEYGGANGGIISTELRTGTQQMHVSVRAETDNYTKQGTKALGGYSYGYSDLVGTVSGPVVSDKVRFFGSVENTFYRDPGNFVAAAGSGINGQNGIGTNFSVANPSFWDGLNFQGMVPDPQYTVANRNTLTQDTINLNYPAGNSLGGQLNQFTYSGTLLVDLGDIQLRGAGSYSHTFSQSTASVHNFLDLARLPISKYDNSFANIKMTQFFNPKMYYELNLNYYHAFNQTGLDPKLLTNFTKYGDTTLTGSNPALNYGPTSHVASTSLDNAPWYIFGPTSGGGLTEVQPGTLLAQTPALLNETSLGGRLDFTTSNDKNTLKFGGEYEYYTIRRFAPGAVDGVYLIRHSGKSKVDQIASLNASGYNNYGYDVFGNTINSDVVINGATVEFGPPHPVNGALYVEDQIQLSDINLNVGLRYDYINPDSRAFIDPAGISFIDTSNVVDMADPKYGMKKTPATSQISPRIGVSFPVSDMTVFHAQYGKFIQQSELLDSYAGMGRIYQLVQGGNYIQPPTGFGLRPERTTSYELGFSQQIGDNASFDITTFYKDISDQIQARLIAPDGLGQNRNYYTLVNGDFSTSKGIELKITLRRTNRLEAQLNYTFASAEGTGSTANSSEGSASDARGYTAHIPFPTSFSQQNTGSINLDYRFAKNDGGQILERSGLNVLMTFGSGYPFTLETVSQNNIGDARFQVPNEPIGYSTTPWSFSVDFRIDKTVTISSSVDAMFYIYVQNLLNSYIATNANIRTGDPANDGWLGTPQGIAYKSTQSDPNLYESLYNAAYNGNNSGNYLSPRQIRFGVKIDY
jgi:outer membrane receptor protein involved in Fe transport